MEATFKDRYQALNSAQKRAVDTTDGPVMVVAGPGSGKTELLALRVGAILQNGTAKASSILLLTFTETAARNMRERLEALIGADAYRVAIYTFHGFCTDIIGRYPEYFFEATHFRPASTLIQSEILQTIFERLPHKHILGGFHPERGYAYLKESQARIQDIKKGGLTPERFRELLTENERAYTTLNLLLKDLLPERIGKDSRIFCEKLASALEKTSTNLGSMYAASLLRACKEVDETEKTTPLSTWKTEHTTKDEQGARVFKDYLMLPKLFALGDIYEQYQASLHKEGYFDYDDMILQVVDVLQKNITLRTELEELYQYIMVDEFQDTNNAQLLLVKALSSNPVHEGRPNVCVVGDDDQAIYKFQGAEISNILSFRELYNDVEVIVLTDNYRSTQKVLDFARAIVTQGVERLETTYKEIRKDLTARNTKLESGALHTHSFTSQEEEYVYIAEEVKKLLKEGVVPQEIALIAREHRQLTALLPYLDTVGIPYTYERKENVFDEPHVKELIVMCDLLSSINGTSFQKDHLLPTVLAFPFWGIDRITIWRIAEHAKKEGCTWLEAMLTSEYEDISKIAHFLIELGVASQTTPLEIILDTLIGSKDHILVQDGEHDDEYTNTPYSLTLQTNFTSPYKEYYFSKELLREKKSAYIHFLSSLSEFIKALREYREYEILKVHDVMNFVQMHVDYNVPLTNKSAFAHNENAVSLLTSHGAKGLEFAYVFIVSVHDDIWAGSKRGNKLSFPINMPLGSAGDTEDDFIRLFYVALTRARHTLYITHHKSPLRFLSTSELPDTDTSPQTVHTPELLASGLQVYHTPPFAKDEKALLHKVIEGYMLSPTHLNNFLDLTKGGPMMFLEQNLLRFPQAKTASSVYGTAVHKALEEGEIYAKAHNTTPPLETLITSFTTELKRGRLQDFEQEKLEARGKKILEQYYSIKKDAFSGTHLVEVNFANQSVHIDGALLTGKIDKLIEKEPKILSVVDLKTGKGFDAWEQSGMTPYDKIKLHHYKHQLMMYKLLVEHSRDYSTYSVTSGTLEFVEELSDTNTIQELTLPLGDKATEQELSRFTKLVQAVYTKITTLDFPDTSSYEATLDGIRAFEEDLIAGTI